MNFSRGLLATERLIFGTCSIWFNRTRTGIAVHGVTHNVRVDLVYKELAVINVSSVRGSMNVLTNHTAEEIPPETTVEL